jgi:hypothetical protein
MSHVSQESDREGVILPARAVSAGQPPANPLVSARIQHAPSEMNCRPRHPLVRTAARTGRTQAGRPGNARTPLVMPTRRLHGPDGP